MTVDEFVLKLKRFNHALPEVRDNLILDAVFASAAIAKRRVIGSRATHDGAIFGIYSPAYLKKRIKKGKGPDPRINFSFTGHMWKTTQPFITSSSEDEVRIRVAPVDKGREKVMEYHDKRFGEVIELADEEIKLIEQHFEEGLQEFINNSFQ